MDAKLTLKLEKRVIDQAKRYASEHDISLSKLIENYLAALTVESEEKDEISPLVKSLSGVVQLPLDSNEKELFHKHLNDKYV